jgi:tetratricopeptide (TPR) repeat protein
MADNAAEDGARYWAFISYSHKDAAFGRRLHSRLENYVLPARLVGRPTPQGPVPRRLAPIFRDREELPAAHNLSAEVRAALKASRSLVVVCSPSAAGSRWVGREIEVFRALHPDRPILAAVREGEPADCFHASLSLAGDGSETVEPLAADFRRGHDGEHLGLLKLVAGIAGVGLDELVQRDAHRKTQRVTAVTAGALVVALLMGLLAMFALNARSDAERQRGEAEGLVEFMLTDLRDRLKGVGRLDVMTAVNARALHYYSDEDLDRLPVDSLERRARILHAMGEDDETRGDHGAALKKFREAARTTAALLAESPNDPERIYDHAQSEFYFGSVDYDRHRYSAAKPAFLAYKALADRMIEIDPGKTKYRMEALYAENNLCSIALAPPPNPNAAVQHCKAALTHALDAAHHPDKTYDNAQAKRGIDDFVMNCHANLADAYRLSHDVIRAKSERLAEEKLLDRQIAVDPKNMELKDTWIALQRALADLDAQQGNHLAAQAHLNQALTAADEMIRFDPSNKRWVELQSILARTAIRSQDSQGKGIKQ